MSARLDVDYLLQAHRAGPPALDRPVIYRYRSGILRPRLNAILDRSAARDGRMVAPAALPPSGGFDCTGLLDNALFRYDWPGRPTRGLTRTRLASVLSALVSSLPHPSIHAVPHGSEVAQHAAWRRVEAVALVLEEPLVTRASLRPILDYLAATSDLAPDIDLLAQPGFVTIFEDLLEPRAELPALIRAFDERVLLCLDPATRCFDAAHYTREVARRSGRRVMLPALRDLTALRRERDLVDLLDELDERRSGRSWTAAELLGELYRKAAVLLRAPVPARSRTDPRGRVAPRTIFEGGLLWGALLLAWEERLGSSLREEATGYRRGPDTLVTNLAGLGRDFLARAPDAQDADPLSGRWSALGRTLEHQAAEGPLVCARFELLDALEQALVRAPGRLRGWMRRLLGQVIAARSWFAPCHCRLEEVAQPETPRMTQPNPEAPPQSVPTLVGRTRLVAALRRHAAQPGAANNILLHGPDGVGKRSLARIYARAMLCEAQRAEGVACGTCPSCAYPEGAHPRIFPYDGASNRIASITGSVAPAIRSSFWTERCVFIVDNADRYPPGGFDALLAPMENSDRASFVLLARDRRAVRLAGQSRCFDYRVRPLGRSETEAFLREVLAARGLACDAAAMSLMVDASGGLPSRLLNVSQILADTLPAGFETLRTKLGLGWAEELVPRWPTVVAGMPATLADLMRLSSADRREQVRRIQAVLQLISLRGAETMAPCEDAIDPALRQLDDQTRATLAVAIDGQAVRDGTTAEAFWMSMVETWMSDRLATG